ncbi:preprotein translocase subunit SecE [Arcanobacterium wilhelmae]|uniref:Protein translocase subunit SecE n=1 Tax=Arcanobacterium wilhelmae TaxID=1803177 RepID=A0ABT9NCD3_9ACTO|nr:preprotein translocase subunit SecE [Arcanobacterium wilhelmae]MDP9801370.1 preprotein translocase subunit SecE [Arcanobacterium wilhelmae]WFN90705.1 preprotein translocase subunit SecE [Arcanobacterium wilhelmae]
MNEARRSPAKEGFFARIITFFKEVIAEFKKVQRPTREELWKMFVTVVVFVTIIMVFVTAVDLVFNQSMFWIFG